MNKFMSWFAATKKEDPKFPTTGMYPQSSSKSGTKTSLSDVTSPRSPKPGSHRESTKSAPVLPATPSFSADEVQEIKSKMQTCNPKTREIMMNTITRYNLKELMQESEESDSAASVDDETDFGGTFCINNVEVPDDEPEFVKYAREVEDWELNILALEKGEWGEAMSDACFHRWKKERGKLASVFAVENN